MQKFMFPQRLQLRKFLPKVFKTMKKIRCIVDCTEFRVECSKNFARQGNTFSSYKHTNTFKCLIAVTPNGGACFVSDLFEGDTDDVQMFKENGLMKHLKAHDVVSADRGFTVRELLNPLQVELKIPSFLKDRKSLSAAEELETGYCKGPGFMLNALMNASSSSSLLVEKYLCLSLPLQLKMVVVAAWLVNFQDILCK